MMSGGCEPVGEPALPGRPPLVVEGWIEEGLPPVVMLTRAVDLTGDSATFDGFVEKWARVSVFDGETRHVLTGRINRDYVPEFIYTAAELVGQPGHTYRLLVETETDTLTASATMPGHPRLERLEAERVGGSDTLWLLKAYVGQVAEGDYYKLFVREDGEDRRYYGAFMGTFSASAYAAEDGWTITRGLHATYDDTDSPFSHYFKSGSRVSVRLCSLESAVYDFWNVYDSNISMGQNLFFTFAGNCPGNIDGGLGYWAAYGMSSRSIVIPD